jgi:hypothetical protein
MKKCLQIIAYPARFEIFKTAFTLGQLECPQNFGKHVGGLISFASSVIFSFTLDISE